MVSLSGEREGAPTMADMELCSGEECVLAESQGT